MKLNNNQVTAIVNKITENILQERIELIKNFEKQEREKIIKKLKDSELYKKYKKILSYGETESIKINIDARNTYLTYPTSFLFTSKSYNYCKSLECRS